jgi:hypothetical protein
MRHYNANTNKGVERYAIAAYVQYGVRMHVPLSAPARRELQRMRASCAGLAELQAAQGMQRLPFETLQQFTARELQVRTDARTLQVAHEVQANP